MINLGTCGGFAGLIAPGEIVLADKTVVYDIVEQMGDPDEAVAHYATVLNLDWLGDVYPYPVRRTVLVSGERPPTFRSSTTAWSPRRSGSC